MGNISSPKCNRVGRRTKTFLRALLDTTLEVMRLRKARKTRKRDEKSINLEEKIKEKMKKEQKAELIKPPMMRNFKEQGDWWYQYVCQGTSSAFTILKV